MKDHSNTPGKCPECGEHTWCERQIDHVKTFQVFTRVFVLLVIVFFVGVVVGACVR